MITGTGLFETLEIIYDTNAIKYMLCVETIARVIRSHQIISSVMNTTIVKESLCSQKDLTIVRSLFERLFLFEDISLKEVPSDVIAQIETKFAQTKEELKSCRTALLRLI